MRVRRRRPQARAAGRDPPGPGGLGRRCRGDHDHVVLAGSCKAWDAFKGKLVWRRRTEVAGIYTDAFCRAGPLHIVTQLLSVVLCFS